MIKNEDIINFSLYSGFDPINPPKYMGRIPTGNLWTMINNQEAWVLIGDTICFKCHIFEIMEYKREQKINKILNQ